MTFQALIFHPKSSANHFLHVDVHFLLQQFSLTTDPTAAAAFHPLREIAKLSLPSTLHLLLSLLLFPLQCFDYLQSLLPLDD
jgi:hypothetical protein